MNNVLSWVLIGLSMACVSVTTMAQSLVSHHVSDHRILLTLDDNSKVRVSFLGHNTVEVLYRADEKQLPSMALPAEVSVKPVKVGKAPEGTTFSYGRVTARVSESPFQLAFYFDNEHRLSEEKGFFHVDSLRGFRFALQPDEQLYGGGQRVLGMDRRGHKMPLYNRAHYGYTTESNQMYYSLPAVMSSENYAVVFDNSASGNLDIGHSEADVLQFDARAGRTAYLVTLGENLADVSRNLVSVTGKQPLPPRWALGNFASRFGYRNESQTRDVVKRYQDADIPLDGVVLDLYWFGKDVKGHMGNLSWDREAFPDPDGMMADFREQDVQTIVITEPFVLTTSSHFDSAVQADALAKSLDGEVKTFDFYFGNTGLVDVFSPAGRDWFKQYYTKLAEQGVAGWWGDLGEPEVHPGDTLHNVDGSLYTADAVHNAYGHRWAQMVYEHSLDIQPDKRPFVLMRSGFVGSQRFGMIPWTGDVSRSWGGLKPQVELALQMGVFGLAYTHSDLGGFAGGDEFDAELYQRWLQLGVFSPVFRPHAQEDIAPEPVYHDQQTVAQARDLIRLRYQMLPYNYALSIENSLTGMPMMRPLSFYHEGDAWFTNKDSYYWGENLLISPVTEAGVSEWMVDLPPGTWYHFYTDEIYTGGKPVSVPASLTQIPVMVKAGGVVPMLDAASTTAEADFSQMTMHVWAGEQGVEHQYHYYEDDGKRVDSLKDNAFMTGQVIHQRQSDSMRVQMLTTGGYDRMPTNRELEWVLHGLTQQPEDVMLSDKVAVSTDKNSAVYWDASSKTLHVNQRLQGHGEFTVHW
ncbi:DUF5110 domain-containing protein [Alteromonas sp. ASW11-19]|uniref:DUF5110 domain-containing protein n=1 Tax=Alteromonas salexigens TaxID=2982530 RepID=A0ABT2VME5_9ALTE|nr:TIM-barrel domain-containing protein [Alteromonas salexigens]MCU7554244.1 DUF5110 domain-containing protein [Alteromonas salexigens]